MTHSPQGTFATCCTSCLGRLLRNLQGCIQTLSQFFVACGNVGVDCTGPATSLPPLGSEQLPPNWTIAVPCAIVNANRVIEDTIVTYLTTTTPASCVASCAAQGFTFAGVEFSDECYCGTGFTDGQFPPEAAVSECNMPCAGDAKATCGGSWRMQVYRLSQ